MEKENELYENYFQSKVASELERIADCLELQARIQLAKGTQSWQMASVKEILKAIK